VKCCVVRGATKRHAALSRATKGCIGIVNASPPQSKLKAHELVAHKAKPRVARALKSARMTPSDDQAPKRVWHQSGDHVTGSFKVLPSCGNADCTCSHTHAFRHALLHWRL